jgi:hypothetical protein
MINLFKKIDYYLEQLTGDMAKMMLTNLAQEICVNVILSAKYAKANPYTQTNPIVCEAIAYIDSHLLTLQGLEDICKEFIINLKRQQLTDGSWDYLEPHAFEIIKHIENRQLRAMHIMEG